MPDPKAIATFAGLLSSVREYEPVAGRIIIDDLLPASLDLAASLIKPQKATTAYMWVLTTFLCVTL